jgi:hypothetical protein
MTRDHLMMFSYHGNTNKSLVKYKGTFKKCSILSKVKEDENFNPRNTFSISKIKI